MILLFISISASSAKKTVYVDFETGDGYTTIWFKNGTKKTLTAKDGDRYKHFDDYYEFDKSLIEPTVVTGYSEPLCLGGVVYLTNSSYDADFVVKETSSNDYECTIRIVDKTYPNCDEWRITSERALAKYKVYIAPRGELEYDYKVRIIR